MTSPEVDDYISKLPDDRRAGMEQIRAAVRAGAPEAVEVITYKMPGLKSHGGQFLVSYDAYKRHYSLFPASEAVIQAVGERLRPHLSGSGTIQFRRDQSLPLDMITRIVEIRYAENAARAEQEGRR
jgi:uncharacterized protein YdhG (YjbR/CyaY superfamily)